MTSAVFLDRDGVINRLVFNSKTQAYESPHAAADFELYPWTIDALSALYQLRMPLFLISNQPSFAKGKTTMAELQAIQAILHQRLTQAGITFTNYYYCYHHPKGIVPELTGTCACRKPEPYFLLKAQQAYCLNLSESWLIGDQDSDIFCGQKAGVRTILIAEPDSAAKRGNSRPDYGARDLRDAVNIIRGSATEAQRHGEMPVYKEISVSPCLCG